MSQLDRVHWTAEFTVSLQAAVAAVTVTQDEILVSFRSLREGLAFWRQCQRTSRSRFLRTLATFAEATQRTLSIDLERDVVATLGPKQRGGLFEKAFGLWPLKLRWKVLGRAVVSGLRSR